MHLSFLRVVSFLLFIVQGLSGSHISWGSVWVPPPSLVGEVLSESVPTAFPLGGMDVADFSTRWEGKPIEGVRFRLGSGTIQWVRVSEVLVIPRARLIVDAEGAEGGQVSNGGFVQSFHGNGHVEIPVALISGAKNPISIQVKRSGRMAQGTLLIEFKPQARRRDSGDWIYRDPSCSPYHLTLTPAGSERQVRSWVEVGCRLVRVENEEHPTSSLEVFLFWDNVGQSIRIDGVETSSTSPSLWPLRLASEPGEVLLESGDQVLKLEYHVPKFLHSTSLSMGLGPYVYSFQGGGEDFHALVPMATLYGSYFVTEAIRVVGFGATIIDSHHLTDVGLYLYLESNRFLDRRAAIHLLVGGHGIGFGVLNQYYFVPSLPQGFELSYSDAFARGKSLKLGAFIYPPISNNSYYNVWLRWGAQWFIEANYLSWQLQPNVTIYDTSSIGFSVGFPLFQLW